MVNEPSVFELLKFHCSILCIYTFASNCQLSFLSQRKVAHDRRNYIMISLQESYIAELGFEFETPKLSVIRQATVYAMEPRLLFRGGLSTGNHIGYYTCCLPYKNDTKATKCIHCPENGHAMVLADIGILNVDGY